MLPMTYVPIKGRHRAAWHRHDQARVRREINLRSFQKRDRIVDVFQHFRAHRMSGPASKDIQRRRRLKEISHEKCGVRYFAPRNGYAAFAQLRAYEACRGPKRCEL